VIPKHKHIVEYQGTNRSEKQEARCLVPGVDACPSVDFCIRGVDSKAHQQSCIRVPVPDGNEKLLNLSQLILHVEPIERSAPT